MSAPSRKSSRLNFQSLLILPLYFSASMVMAGPEGGQVTGGEGRITQQGNTTRIDQESNRLAIDWQSFDVEANERVQFVQPDSTSVALNRVLSNQGSRIMGQIDANGQVILVNPNGVIFGKDSVINAGGILASGLSIDPDDFMNGNFTFKAIEGTEGVVINNGLLNAAAGGSISLIGQQVENHGLISAQLGAVNLAAGKEAVVTFDAEGLVGVRVTEAVLQDDIGVDPAVLNAGEIRAEDGQILISASVSQDIFSQAVNAGDMHEARSVVVNDDGSFTLGGGADVVNTGLVSTSGASGGEVVVLGENISSSGSIVADSSESSVAGAIELHSATTTMLTAEAEVSAQSESGTGGDIKLLGHNVGVEGNATVSVSGLNGGGSVLVGGDITGANPLVRNAEFIYLGQDTEIHADAYGAGDGGKVITFAANTARVFGSLTARGGNSLGDGGFIETSGMHGFEIRTNPDVSAKEGAAGQWLIDPYNITIRSSDFDGTDDYTTVGSEFTASTDGATISRTVILNALVGGATVIVQTADPAGTDDGEAGNIVLSTSLEFTSDNSGNTLILNAHNDLTFNSGAASITNDSTTNGFNLQLNAGVNGGIYLNNNNITTGGGNFSASGASFSSSGTINVSSTHGGGNITINAGIGDVTLGALTVGEHNGSDTEVSPITASTIDIDAGNITVLGDINYGVGDGYYNHTVNIDFDATNNITFTDVTVDNSGTGKDRLNVSLTADSDGSGAGDVTITRTSIWHTGGSFVANGHDFTFNTSPSATDTIGTEGGKFVVGATLDAGGNIVESANGLSGNFVSYWFSDDGDDGNDNTKSYVNTVGASGDHRAGDIYIRAAGDVELGSIEGTGSGDNWNSTATESFTATIEAGDDLVIWRPINFGRLVGTGTDDSIVFRAGNSNPADEYSGFHIHENIVPDAEDDATDLTFQQIGNGTVDFITGYDSDGDGIVSSAEEDEEGVYINSAGGDIEINVSGDVIAVGFGNGGGDTQHANGALVTFGGDLLIGDLATYVPNSVSITGRDRAIFTSTNRAGAGSGGQPDGDSSNSVEIYSTGDVELGQVWTGGAGSLLIDADGAVSQLFYFDVGGNVVVRGGTGVDLTLTDNDFRSTVSLSGADVSIYDKNALILGSDVASNITGNFDITANGNITDGGAISVAGTTEITAGNNSVELDAAHDFQGALTVVSANQITLNDLNALILGDIQIDGAGAANAITAGGAITQTTGAAEDIVITSSSDDVGSLTLSGNSVAVGAISNAGNSNQNAGDVTIYAPTGGITLGNISSGEVTLTGNVTLASNVVVSAAHQRPNNSYRTADVTINGTINSQGATPYDLTIDAANITLRDHIGSTQSLGDLIFNTFNDGSLRIQAADNSYRSTTATSFTATALNIFTGNITTAGELGGNIYLNQSIATVNEGEVIVGDLDASSSGESNAGGNIDIRAADITTGSITSQSTNAITAGSGGTVAITARDDADNATPTLTVNGDINVEGASAGTATFTLAGNPGNNRSAGEALFSLATGFYSSDFTVVGNDSAEANVVDTFTLQLGATEAAHWNLGAATTSISDDADAPTSTITFESFESIHGGDQSDNFVIANAGFALIAGEGGADSFTTDATVPLTQTQLSGGDGNDSFHLWSSVSDGDGDSSDVLGEAGDDTFYIHAGNISTEIDGGDHATDGGGAPANGDLIELTSDVTTGAFNWHLTGNNQGTFNNNLAFANVENINGSNSTTTGDAFVIDNGVVFDGDIDARDGEDEIVARDITISLSQDVSGVKNAEIARGDGNGTITVTGVNGVALWQIGDFDGVGTGDADGQDDGQISDSSNSFKFIDYMNLVGSGAADTFEIDATGQVTGSINGGGISGNTLRVLSGTNNWELLREELPDNSIRYYGALTHSGADSSENYSFQFDNIQTLEGGAGTDTIVGRNQANTWDFTTSSGSNLNTVNSGNPTLDRVAFSGMEYVTGGDLSDTFNLDRASVAIRIDGGAGIDTIHRDIANGAWTLSTATAYSGTVTGLTNAFTNIEVLEGSGSDSLTGRNLANNWLLDQGDNIFTVTNIVGDTDVVVSFSGMDSLVGGSLVDRFDVQQDFSGSLSGGAGDDVFDVSSGLNYQLDISGDTGVNTLELGHNVDSLWSLTGSGSGEVTSKAPGQRITLSGMQFVESGGGNDTFNINADGFSQISGGQGDDEFNINIAFTGRLNGDGGSDEFVFLANGSAIRADATATSIDGGADTSGDGSDIDSIVGHTAGPNRFDITGNGTGNVYDIVAGTGDTPTNEVYVQNFDGIERLVGSDTHGDYFHYSSTSSFIQSINAGDVGEDIFAYTLIDGTKVSGEMQDLTLGNGGLSGIELLIGNQDGSAASAGNISRLIYASNTGDEVVWTISEDSSSQADGINDGIVGGIKFIDFNQLIGGDGNDTFDFQRDFVSEAGLIARGVAALVDGRGGVDTILGSNADTTWTFGGTEAAPENTFEYITGFLGRPVETAFSNIDVLVGGSETDDFNVRRGGVVALDIDGGVGGGNTLSGHARNNTWLIGADNSLNTDLTFSNIQNYTGGALNDTFTLQQGSVAGVISGGAQTANTSGDTLIVASTAAETINWSVSANGRGTVAGRIDNSFVGIESLEGGDGNDHFTVTSTGNVVFNLDGNGGVNRLTGAARANTWLIGTSNTLNSSIVFAEIDDFYGQGKFDDDFTIEGAGVVTGTINAGEHLLGDSLTVESVAGTSVNWNITNVGAGNVVDRIAGSFTGIERATGGAGEDNFSIRSNFGTIEGGAGEDIFSFDRNNLIVTIYGESESSVTTTGTGDTIVGFTSGENQWQLSGAFSGEYTNITTSEFHQISNFEGNSNSDVLIGRNQANTWTLTGSETSVSQTGNTSDLVNFSGMDVLRGGNAVDTFEISANFAEIRGEGGSDIFNINTQGLSGEIVGGGESDDVSGNEIKINNGTSTLLTLNGDREGTAVNGNTGNLTFSNVQTFTGGSSGQDQIVGANLVNAWEISTLGGGSVTPEGSVKFNFTGFENISGGLSSDTFRFVATGGVANILRGYFQGDEFESAVNTIVSRTGVNNTWELEPGNGSMLNLRETGASGWYVHHAVDIDVLQGHYEAGENGTGDTITVINPNYDFTWNITGDGDGTVYAPNYTTYSFVDMYNVEGNNGNDVFNFVSGTNAANGGLIRGEIDGAEGSNTLIGRNSESLWNLAEGNSLSVVDTSDASADYEYVSSVRNIQTIQGGTGADTLQGTDRTTTWTISGENLGTVESNDANSNFTFSQMENLTGGTGRDEFIFNSLSSLLTGLVDGGEGEAPLNLDTHERPNNDYDSNVSWDRVDLSGYTNGVLVEVGESAVASAPTAIQEGVIVRGNVPVVNVNNIEAIRAAQHDHGENSGENQNWITVTHNRPTGWDFSAAVDNASQVNNGWVFELDGETQAAAPIQDTYVRLINFGSVQEGSGIQSAISVNPGSTITGYHIKGDGKTWLYYSENENAVVNIDDKILGIVGGGSVLLRVDDDSEFYALDNSWLIDAVNSGTFSATRNEGTVDEEAFSFTFEGVNQFEAGAGNDVFTFTETGSLVNGWINAGDGENQLLVDALSTANLTFGWSEIDTEALQFNAHYPVNGDFSDIYGLVRRGEEDTIEILGFDTLDAADAASVTLASGHSGNTLWSIGETVNASTQNRLNVAGEDVLVFSGVDAIRGGTTNDTFNFYALDIVSNEIDGGGHQQGGADVVDLTNIVGDLEVSLAPSADLAGKDIYLSNVESMLVSAGAHSLYGANVETTWQLESANSGSLSYGPAANRTTFSYNNISFLVGGSASDHFTILGGSGGWGTIDGGEGVDDINVADSQTSPLTFQLSERDGGRVVDAGANIINVDAVETINANANVAGDTLIARDIANTWTISNASNINGMAFSGFDNLTGGSDADAFTFDGALVSGLVNGGLNVDGAGLAVADTMNIVNINDAAVLLGNRVTASALNVVGVEQVATTGTNQTFIADNANNTWDIEGTNSGSVGTTEFTGFANIVGGNLNDTFVLDGSDRITGVIDGGVALANTTPDDVLNIEALDSAVVVSFDADYAADLHVNNLSEILALTAEGKNNTLVGPNTETQWNINGSNRGEVNATEFAGFNRLIGLQGRDVFTFSENGEIELGVDGGDGDAIDELDMSLLPVVVVTLGDDMPNGVTGVESFRGNNVNSTIIATVDTNNTWNVDGVNSGTLNNGTETLVFRNFNFLVGGESQDDFILSGTGGVTGGIRAGGGNDTLTMAIAAASASTVFDGGEGEDSIAISGGFESTTARYTFEGDSEVLSYTSQVETSLYTSDIVFNGVEEVTDTSRAASFTVVARDDVADSVALAGTSPTQNLYSLQFASEDQTTTSLFMFDNKDSFSLLGNSSDGDSVSVSGTLAFDDIFTLRSMGVVASDLPTRVQAGSVIFDSVNGIGQADQRLVVQSGSLTLDNLLGDTYIRHLGNLSFAGIDDPAGLVDIAATGTITSTGALTSDNAVILASDGEMTLNHVDNALNGSLTLDAGESNITLLNNGATELNGIIANDLILTVAGRVSDSGPVTVDDLVVNVLEGESASLVLDHQDNAFVSVELNGLDSAVVADYDGGDLDIKAENIGGALNVTSLGEVDIERITASGPIAIVGEGITIGGAVDVTTASAANSITLDAGNGLLAIDDNISSGASSANTGDVIVTARAVNQGEGTSITGNTIAITATDNVQLGGDITGNFASIAGGDISLTGAVSLNGQNGEAETASSQFIATGGLNLSSASSVNAQHSVLFQALSGNLDGGISTIGNATFEFNDVLNIAGNIQGANVFASVANGAINMGSASLIQAQDLLSMDAKGQIRLGQLMATAEEGLVQLVSQADIVDGNDAGSATPQLNISAYALESSTETGFGVNDPIELQVGNIHALNNTGAINAANIGDLNVTAIRSNGNIFFHNTGDMYLIQDVPAYQTEQTAKEGTNDARTAGGPIGGQYISSYINLHVTGSLQGVGNPYQYNDPDIIANEVAIQTDGAFGSYNHPLILFVRTYGNILDTSVSGVRPECGFGVCPTDGFDGIEDLSDSSLFGSVSELLVEVEEIDEVNPAVFTDLRNYAYDDISILMPRDQRYDLDEDDEDSYL